MKKAISLLLALTLLTLAACGGQERTAPDGPEENPPAQVGGTDPADAPEPGPADSPAPEEEPAPEKPEEPPVPAREEYLILDPTVMPEGGQRDGVTYEAYDGIVEHLFFHPIIAYTELAFDGDAQANGLDDFMVTVDEFNRILDNVYEKGYILVDIGDVWSETTGEDGQPKMVRNTLYLPEGKKPLVFSYDDTNYYPYMLENGLTYKLILGEDGKVWSWGLDPQGNEVVSRDLDAIPILDKFVEEHPDFSPFGAKACLSVTGYEGLLGYRTQTDSTVEWTAEREASRQAEREAVVPIIEELKRTGWTFGSHTWGHICRARASGCSAPWAPRASAISRRTSAPSSATASTPTERPSAGPGTAICSSMTPRRLWTPPSARTWAWARTGVIRQSFFSFEKEKNQKKTLLFVIGLQTWTICAPYSRIARPAGQKYQKRTLMGGL